MFVIMIQRFLLLSIVCCALAPDFAAPSPSLVPGFHAHVVGRASTSKLTISPNATCGGSFGYTCLGSTYGNCCSATNYCLYFNKTGEYTTLSDCPFTIGGSSSAYCGVGCQADFGACDNSLPISSDGSCGGSAGSTCQGSDFGNCCSMRGYCGSNSSYCGAGCQSGFGTCSSQSVSSDGSCGGSAGITCQGSDYGNCCSMRGYCGANSSYCGAGCQSEFGTCFPSTTPSVLSSAASSLAGNTASASTTSQSSHGRGLSGSAIAGIVVGTSAGLAVIGALAWFFLPRRNASRQAPMTDTPGSDLEYVKPPFVYPSEIGAGDAIRELPNNEKTVPQELHSTPKERALVDERAAAGYDGAYRGH